MGPYVHSIYIAFSGAVLKLTMGSNVQEESRPLHDLSNVQEESNVLEEAPPVSTVHTSNKMHLITCTKHISAGC